MLTEITNQEQVYQRKCRRHILHVISAQIIYWSLFLVIVITCLLYQPRYGIMHSLVLISESFLTCICIRLFIKTLQVRIIYGGALLAILLGLVPLAIVENHNYYIYPCIIIFYFFYHFVYTGLFDYRGIGILMFGKSKGITFWHHILSLIAARAKLCSHTEWNQWSDSVRIKMHEKYYNSKQHTLCYTFNGDKTKKIQHQILPHQFYKAQDHVKNKEEMEKLLCRKVMAYNDRKLMKLIYEAFRRIKMDDKLTDMIQFTCPGSGGIYANYEFAEPVWGTSFCYQEASDVDIKLHVYENLSDEQWNAFKMHLLQLLEWIRDSVPKEIELVTGDRYMAYERGKRSYIATQFDDLTREREYTDLKSPILMYSLNPLGFEVPHQPGQNMESTEKEETKFNLGRVTLIMQHTESYETYKVEILDISMEWQSDPKFKKPLELKEHIEKKHITVNGIHYPEWNETKRDNHRLIEEARDELRKRKCKWRDDIHATMEYLFGEQIYNLNASPAKLTESEVEYLTRIDKNFK